MTIKTGDQLPSIVVQRMGEKGPEDINIKNLSANKKIVLFAVPGAFTPGCSVTHMPGFVINADNIKSTGVDDIMCISVNDAFVMDAWGKSSNAEEIIMLADGNADFTNAIGLTMDAQKFGMGLRSQRYSMIINNGQVVALNIETGHSIDKSSAETVLKQLDSKTIF